MEIKISKCAKACSACERDFGHEEEFFSRLDLGEEEEGFLRRDFCEACWRKDGTAEKAYSVWSPGYYDPNVVNPQEEEVFSPLRQLFYEAVESEDRAECAKAYLAAQLLRRQKVFRLLKESGESDGEIRLLLYTDRIGSRLIEVRDPNFSYAELDAARQHLLERLRELEAPDDEDSEAQNDKTDGFEDDKELEGEGADEVEHATQHDG